MRPEGQFGAENGLALQTRSLTDEQVIVIPLRKTASNIDLRHLLINKSNLQRLPIDIERFRSQIKRQTAIGPSDHAGVAFLNGVAVFVKVCSPAYRVLHFEFEASATLFIEGLLFVDFVLVRLRIERSRLHRQKVGQFDEMKLFADVGSNVTNKVIPLDELQVKK